MKKNLKIIGVLLCVFILVLSLVACNEDCTHVDENADSKCDKCGEELPSSCVHVDKNLDEKCDLCGESRPLNDGKETYSVQVSNGIGGGYIDFIVDIFQGTEKVASLNTDENGCAYVRLSLNKYRVELIDVLNRNFHLQADALELTPVKKNLVVEATCEINGLNKMDLMESDYMGASSAPVIRGEGSFRVNVNSSKITPVIWVAEKTGVYTLTFVYEYGATLGYYGMPLLYYPNNICNEEDVINEKSFKLTIKQTNLENEYSGASLYVLGMKATNVDGTGILKIQKTEEAPYELTDVPWEVYSGYIPGALNLPETLSEYDLEYLDLTQNHNIVFNPTDKLYHLGSENGKVVYVQMKHTPTTMPAAPAGENKDYFTLEGLIYNDHMGAYIFKDGIVDLEHLISKNSYQAHAQACLEMAHEVAGIYYLTEGLMLGIQESGVSRGWWDFDSERQIFGEKAGVTVLEEYAWMFCLCTIND